MRTVEISKGWVEGILCPMQFRNGENVACDCDCAWFSIRYGSWVGDIVVDIHNEYAYCKDHCIGKIKEPDNG